MNNINYDKIQNDIIKSLGVTPRLLIHSCCAPCSSYVLEYLSQYFEITVLYYNPNISPKEKNEFLKQFIDRITFDSIDLGRRNGAIPVLEIFLKQ